MKQIVKHIIIILIFICPVSIFAQESNLTTYYTSPFGSYDRLRLVPRAEITPQGALGDPCQTPGLMYTEETAGEIRFCRDEDGDGEGLWGQLSGVWNKVATPDVGDDEYFIFPVSTLNEDPDNLSTLVALGIGTTDPFKVAPQTKHQRLHIHNSGMDFINFLDPNAKGSAMATSTLYEEANVLFTVSEDQTIRIAGTNDSAGMGSIRFTEVDPDDGSFQNHWLLQSFTDSTGGEFAINRYERGDTGWMGFTPNYGVLVFSKDRDVGIGKFHNNPASAQFNPILAELHIQRDGGEAALRIDELLNDPNIVYDLRTIEGAPVDRFSISGGYEGDEDVERMTLNTSGNLGIATNNPQAKLHIDGDASLNFTGNDSGITLYDTNDGAFKIRASSDNYMRFGKDIDADDDTILDPASWKETLKFLYDPTESTTKHRYKAGFGIIERGTAEGQTEPSASLDIMNDGAMIIRPAPCSGSCAPRLTLDNIRGADFQFKVDNSKMILASNYVANSSFPTLNSGAAFNTPLLTIDYNYQVGMWTSNMDVNNALQIGETGNACYVTKTGTWGSASSRKYKTRIEPLNDQQALAAFKKLEPVTFKFKRETSPAKRSVGFIAEDVPELVATSSRKNINTLDMTALLTHAVKQLNNELEKQKDLIDLHKKEIERLEKQLRKKNLL